MIAISVWLSTFVYGFLALIWSKSNWGNFMAKAVFFALTVLSVVILYKENGFLGWSFK